MMTMVLYHDNCPDGFTAAWAAWKKLGDQSVHYRPMNYGDPIPDDIDGKGVFLVDFSLPLALMEQLAARAAFVTVFDHHKTAQEALRSFTRGKVVFDMERSGAGITWDEMHGAEKRPRLIDYVEDRDLWRWALPSSREVSEYLFSLPRTFDHWDHAEKMLEQNFSNVEMLGATLLNSKRVRVEAICQHARVVMLGGFNIAVVNSSWDMAEIGEYLCKTHPECAAGGYYFDRTDKRQWGLKSRGDFDVSAICKQYGGGGHKNAAGFTSEIGWLP